jgi:hypothetical protein
MYSSSSLFGFALSLFCPMKDLGGFFSSIFLFLFSFIFPLFFSN